MNNSSEAKLNTHQKFLSEEDMAELFVVFSEHLYEDEAPLDLQELQTVWHLVELGTLFNVPLGGFKLTSFGTWLIETEFVQFPTLPLRVLREPATKCSTTRP